MTTRPRAHPHLSERPRACPPGVRRAPAAPAGRRGRRSPRSSPASPPRSSARSSSASSRRVRREPQRPAARGHDHRDRRPGPVPHRRRAPVRAACTGASRLRTSACARRACGRAIGWVVARLGRLPRVQAILRRDHRRQPERRQAAEGARGRRQHRRRCSRSRSSSPSSRRSPRSSSSAATSSPRCATGAACGRRRSSPARVRRDPRAARPTARSCVPLALLRVRALPHLRADRARCTRASRCTALNNSVAFGVLAALDWQIPVAVRRLARGDRAAARSPCARVDLGPRPAAPAAATDRTASAGPGPRAAHVATRLVRRAVPTSGGADRCRCRRCARMMPRSRRRSTGAAAPGRPRRPRRAPGPAGAGAPDSLTPSRSTAGRPRVLRRPAAGASAARVTPYVAGQQRRRPLLPRREEARAPAGCRSSRRDRQLGHVPPSAFTPGGRAASPCAPPTARRRSSGRWWRKPAAASTSCRARRPGLARPGRPRCCSRGCGAGLRRRRAAASTTRAPPAPSWPSARSPAWRAPTSPTATVFRRLARGGGALPGPLPRATAATSRPTSRSRCWR